MSRNTFKDECIRLRKSSLTLHEIMKKTGRSKTSVYFHIRNMPLPPSKIRAWRKKNAQYISNYNSSRKGMSSLNRRPLPFQEWSSKHILLFSHLIFDGEVSERSCIYNNRSKVLIEQFATLMKSVYPYDPVLIQKPDKVFRLSYHNVELATYARSKIRELVEIISKLDREFKRSFLKSFFDDEGCVTFDRKRNKRVIRGYQHNEKILKLVQSLLKNFDIDSVINKARTELIISRRDNLEHFAREINFSPGVRMNGQRKNSIWKKDIEKRAVLQRALESYQTKK